MKTEKEKQPVEPEAQPLQEEELDKVSGGGPFTNVNQLVARWGFDECPFCGKEFTSKAKLKYHKENDCPNRPK